MNRIKLLVLLSMFLIVIGLSRGVLEPLYFTETFGTDEILLGFCGTPSYKVDYWCNRFEVLATYWDNSCWDIVSEDYITYGNNVNLDNEWFCLYSNHTAGFVNDVSGFFNQSNETKVNTKQGIFADADRGIVTCQGISNCRMGFRSMFDEPRYFRDDSEISFYCSDFHEPDHTQIYFGNDIKNTTGFSFSINGDTVGAGCGITGRTPNCCTGFFDSKFFSPQFPCTAENKSFINFTIADLRLNCTDLNDTLLTDINFVEFRYIFGDDRTFGNIDDFHAEMYNGSNVLPIFNITVNATGICANSSLQNLELPLIVDSFDEEEDIILYATGTDETYTGVSFNFQSAQTDQTILRCGDTFGFIGSIFNPLEMFLKFVGFCGLETTPLNVPIPHFTTFSDSCKVIKAINSTEFYIDEKIDNKDNIVNMVIYNPYCSRHKESYVDLNDIYRDFFFNTELYFQNIVNNSFNLTFYDNPLFSDIVARVGFSVNETNNLRVVSLNNTAELLLFNIDLTNNQIGDKSYMALNMKYDFDTNTYQINITDQDNATLSSTKGDGYTTDGSNLIIKYVGLKISNKTQSFLYQENYLYGGFTTSPVFSSAIPNNVTVSGFGKVNIGVFVTDNQHKETEYTFKDTALTITECSMTSEDLEKTPIGIGLAPLKKSLMNICSSLDGAFTFTRGSDGETFDPSRYGFCFIMFVVFFLFTAVLSAGFSIWVYLMKPSLVFPAFLFIWQIFNIFGTLILDYSLTLKLIIGIVFAISGMIGLRQIFLTGDTSTGE